MKSAPTYFHRFEFGFPALDTDVQLEVRDDEVVLRSTRDTFTDERKASFIHELASEGFLPDEYQWFADAERAPTVTWKIDPFWKGEAQAAAHRRLGYVQALSYSALAAALVMGLLFTGKLGGFHLGAPVSQHEVPAATAHR